MVQMYNNGKGINEIVKEYDLTRSALERWMSNYNRTDLENEVLRLQ